MLFRYSALLLLLCCAWAPVADAGIPDPAHCTVPFRFLACPAGDVQFEVVVRDIGNFTISNIPVTLDFFACPGVVFCGDCCPGVTIDRQARTAMAVSDANGVAAFSLKVGGLCPGSKVRVRIWNLLLWDLGVSSPDQDGDLVVGDPDVAIVQALIGTSNASADFVLDGTVTEADLAWQTDLHGGHSCANVVPARTATWGSVKILYR